MLGGGAFALWDYPDQWRDGKRVGHRLEREQFCQQREDALGIGRIVLRHAVVAIKEMRPRPASACVALRP